jgi:hypothetical protein
MKSTVNHPDWPKGWYGLVRWNDPDYIWEGKPVIDPFEDLTDKQINALSDKSRIVKKNRYFFSLVEKIEPQFEASPELGYTLYSACKKAGYDEKKHGYRLIPWLVHHMAKKMKKQKKRKI